MLGTGGWNCHGRWSIEAEIEQQNILFEILIDNSALYSVVNNTPVAYRDYLAEIADDFVAPKVSSYKKSMIFTYNFRENSAIFESRLQSYQNPLCLLRSAIRLPRLD